MKQPDFKKLCGLFEDGLWESIDKISLKTSFNNPTAALDVIVVEKGASFVRFLKFIGIKDYDIIKITQGRHFSSVSTRTYIDKTHITIRMSDNTTEIFRALNF